MRGPFYYMFEKIIGIRAFDPLQVIHKAEMFVGARIYTERERGRAKERESVCVCVGGGGDLEMLCA